MATSNHSNQQQRYAMRDRKDPRRKEVYRPSQNLPGLNHGTREAPMRSGESSPLSSIRSDIGALDERMRDGLVQGDVLNQSTPDQRSSMQIEWSADNNMDNIEQGNHIQDPDQSWASRDAHIENIGLNNGRQYYDLDTRDPHEYRYSRHPHYQTQQRRSASPRPIEETSFRSRSPLHPTTRSGVRTARDFEEQKARIDQEAADFEAEYQQLLLEESVQKRNHIKAMVEEQRRRMSRYSSDILDSPAQESVRDSSTVADDGATTHHGRRALMSRPPTISPARFEVKDEMKEFNPPAGPRGSLRGFAGDRSAPSGPRNNMFTSSPELTIRGTAAAATVPTPLPASQHDKGPNAFERRVLATLAKGYAPRTEKVPAPPRTLGYEVAKDMGRVRLYTEHYGGTRQEDLALCKWVFDTEKECPNGKECPCRHEPLDDEELEWIRTNPVPPQKNMRFHPGRWLERLLQNYSNPRMPKVSKFDRA
ncbi:uncharacterized protein N0V89_003461 [Didymosphaeria variabile]|uniref:C3H1-type domain-containing protein n=1 Tax=Didymosphaeria variabile TaxID=1932322 RepID=A0A9W8XQJ5_9PLEO|nr:uncharacterized protein N0V89_003461 [Didymosphaeria variabile]KAJ4355445.1 hypothetical protein N0V89_003461 [Didymosphaeria variabile]